MSTSGYRHLFTRLRLGPLTLRNRVVFSAHLTGYAVDGLPTPQHAAYYAARAKGGAGLIISEEHATHPGDWPYEKVIAGYRPEVVQGYRRITDAVHEHGVPILAQVNHNGGQGSSMYSRRPLWAPSAVPDPLFREVPKAVDQREIRTLVDGYARVAEHCIRGGFDGIELQCSHSSLVRSFLAPATNQRADRYGGSLANRARFLLEVVAAVRAAIGPDHALGVRLAGEDLFDGGVRLDEAVEVAALVEADGRVDYLNTSIGMATETLHMIEASMAVPRGYALFVPNAIRQRVGLPVVGVGRFTDPHQADRALDEGHCDLIGVVRGQIADPDFAAKALAGEEGEIRTCLACNQECVGRMGLGRWLGCVVNPRAGRESIPLPEPVVRGKRVVVVGGGPAGLKAAATAAQRGHDVTLFERATALGGQVRTAAVVPGRREFAELVADLESECRRNGVDVRIGTDADAETVAGERPDVVVVATGARPRRPRWAGTRHRVVDVRDVLEGRANPSGTVLVVDELGFHQGTSVAEFLADAGCAVTICTPGMIVGQDLGITLDLEGWKRRAHRTGITQVTDVVPIECEDADGRMVVTLLHHPTGRLTQLDLDWVVSSAHQQPEDGLWKELADSGIEAHRVGDALAPRRAHSAVIEGERIALSL
ncbi:MULTISPECIES: mycofactocin system FadH/OYE family oxidoreductase 2 [unclassified Rhodococcus (in: high G+C Gram-positive bacteria)]|uniref:mycofactocin system FadH/OYE family oxidoreductase 2 n=1 Tax=unclassified Rhodococcus (in: high G+C Gram-positive bacteria) TaxID=192944 RepID=UPI00163A773A|nr:MULTISPECIES: mycofactocin system FadH/OYE family oxidoreductase 2 [unclassified Rhodococcus (in: high G+C Gram-positive bacteria)]MBC2643298.1 mycofactocin system FadH/OYE family oxidoreductase 2 [Rhodococcus sp. 3A]MBC2891961.1 mycofactocin system FadH/OYE family oxidoreductase 2 [Rhodococcus sp. 4CII]